MEVLVWKFEFRAEYSGWHDSAVELIIFIVLSKCSDFAAQTTQRKIILLKVKHVLLKKCFGIIICSILELGSSSFEFRGIMTWL